MLSTVLYYELAMKVPIPVGITVYLLTWGLGHLRCLVFSKTLISLSPFDNRDLKPVKPAAGWYTRVLLTLRAVQAGKQGYC